MEKQIANQKTPFWRNKKVLNVLWQVIFLVFIVAVFYYFIQNAIAGLNRIGIKFGFSFLDARANFPIGESVLNYSSSDPY